MLLEKETNNLFENDFICIFRGFTSPPIIDSTIEKN